MGQRHQLFVIAKILGRYRSLAVVHHQWLYGRTALLTCHRLVQIFQDPHNRSLLEHEIVKAEKLRDEDWNAPWSSRGAKPMFPFVTTCLVIGASCDFSTGHTSNAEPMPWNMEFDQGDNNDGVTILDISQPPSVRYCFVIFLDYDRYDELDGSEIEETPHKRMVPLRGAEYLSIYYKEENWDADMKEIAGSLDKFSLIPASSLNEVWPRPEWESRAERGLQPGAEDEQTGIATGLAHLTLASMAMEKSIERILDEEDELLEYVEELPIFQPSLKDYLYKHPSVVTSRRFGFKMLQKALQGCTVLDVHPFADLSIDQVVQLIEGTADPDMLDMLDISGNRNIAVEDIPKILNKTSIKKLYVWDNPQLPYAEFLPFVRAGRVKELLHSGLFAAPFDEDENHGEVLRYAGMPQFQTSAPPVDTATPISSFRQLVWAYSMRAGSSKPFNAEVRASLIGKRLDIFAGSSLIVLPLHDTILAASELLSSLGKLMQCMAMSRFYSFSIGDGGLAFPFGLALRNEESPWAVSPIPCKQYALAQAAYHSSRRAVQREMHPLASGEWTVLVVHDKSETTAGGSVGAPHTDRFYVAFLTVQGGKMRILDAETFMKETNSDGFSARWEEAISGLKGHELPGSEGQGQSRSLVEVTSCDEEIVGNIMAFLEMFKRGEIT